MANRIIKPIDDLISHLLGTKPYDKTGTLKLWEALKTLSDGVFKKGAISTKQVSDSTLIPGGTLEDTLGGLVAGSLLKYAARFSTDIVFSPTDYDTVAWTAGTIRFDDGSVATILAGNTGNMAALTYIVYHPDADPTALQVYTSYTDVAGNNDDRILMCVAKPAVATNQDAFYIPSIGTFGINETVIGPNSISTGKIQTSAITTGLLNAGAVTAAKINVAQLDAISVDAGSLTAGTITGLLIRTASSGARVEINSTDGLKAIDSGGNITAQISTVAVITIQALFPVVTSTQMQLGTTTDNSGLTIVQAGNSAASGLAFVQTVGGGNGTGRVNIGSQQSTRVFVDNTGLNINSGLALIHNGTTVIDSSINITGVTITATTFSGSGSSITSINASNISSGSLADARLSSNVPLKDASNVMTGGITMDSDITIGTGNLIPKRVAQSTIPTPSVGAIVIWRDTDDGKVYLVYNDTDSGVKSVEMI